MCQCPWIFGDRVPSMNRGKQVTSRFQIAHLKVFRDICLIIFCLYFKIALFKFEHTRFLVCKQVNNTLDCCMFICILESIFILDFHIWTAPVHTQTLIYLFISITSKPISIPIIYRQMIHKGILGFTQYD